MRGVYIPIAEVSKAILVQYYSSVYPGLFVSPIYYCHNTHTHTHTTDKATNPDLKEPDLEAILEIVEEIKGKNVT